MEDTDVKTADNELKELMKAALRSLTEEKKEAPEEQPVERKKPTEVAAVDPNEAVERDKEPTFGTPTIIIHPEKHDLKNFSIAKAVRGVAFGNWKGAELEKEYVTKTTLELDDDSLGGFLVPETIVSEIMPMLKAKAVFRAAGATLLPDAGQTTRLPTQTGATTAYWVGMSAQSSAITQSDPTFGQKSLELKRCAARSLIDVDLLRQSFASVEALVRKDIVEQIALAEDLAFWKGAGGTEPMGIIYDPDLNKTTGVGALDLEDDIKGAIDTMAAANADANLNALLMHPTVYGYITNKVDSVDRAKMFASYSADYRNLKVFGLPVFKSTQFDNDSILIANMSEYFIAESGGIEIQVLREKYADQLAIGIVAVHRVDGVARQTAEFRLLTGITS
jgi:HK97 family phage major capsid protein